MADVTANEALAFVRHLLTGKTAIHLEAVLGDGGVASAEDFSESHEEAIERSEDLIAVLEAYSTALHAIVDGNRGRLEKAKQAEKANSLPGMGPDELQGSEGSEERRGRRRKAKEAS